MPILFAAFERRNHLKMTNENCQLMNDKFISNKFAALN